MKTYEYQSLNNIIS